MSNVETVDPTTGEIVVRGSEAEIEAFIAYADSLTIEDPEAQERRIIEQLLGAETTEDILTAGQVTPLEAIFGVGITVTGLRASESDFPDGSKVYLHIEATVIDTGQRVTLACGARDVMLKLVRLHQRGMLPVDVVIRRADKPTKRGFYPIFLTPAEAF